MHSSSPCDCNYVCQIRASLNYTSSHQKIPVPNDICRMKHTIHKNRHIFTVWKSNMPKKNDNYTFYCGF